MSEFKNETLFYERPSEESLRRTVAIALREGWAHLPAPCATIPRAPAHKKKLLLDCEDFRSHPASHANTNRQRPARSCDDFVAPSVPSDVPPPQ